MTPDEYQALSPSSQLALQWASAAARHRSGPNASGPNAEPPAVNAADLLVGVLLAHPREDGEGRTLLSHFGLTARDVLPPGYPSLSREDLQRRVQEVDAAAVPMLSPDAESVVRSAQRTARSGRVHLRYLLAGLLEVSGELRTPLASAFASVGTSTEAVAGSLRKLIQQTDPNLPVGSRLAEMLQEEHPQRPISVPTYSSDKADAEGDLVGIRTEVDAFAYLLASRALHPPLAVGLFGDWGSGKSFLMGSVKHRIERICEQIGARSQSDVPFWKHIQQIEFNAWEYVQGSLWASLLDHIFRELGDQHTIRLVQERRDVVSKELDLARSKRKEEILKRCRLRSAVRRQREELHKATREREQGYQEISKKAKEELEKEVNTQARNALVQVWGEKKSDILDREADELLTALLEARDEVRRGRALLGPYWTRRRVVLATLGALTIPLVALALDWLQLPPLVSILGGLSVIVPAVTTLLRAGTQWSRQQLNTLQKAEAGIRAELARRAKELDDNVEDKRRQLEQAEADLAEVKSVRSSMQARTAELQSRLEELTPGRVFGEYLDERSRSTDYRRHLGLLSTVREDLRNLEDLVKTNNDAISNGQRDDGRPNRIILYIDDLDRCPSKKVIEVLEAVHLLLAFELFVVVVAVDSRWLSFALTDQLDALASDSAQSERPTPHDYLEKIFQLPFWVQPLIDDGRRSLVYGLLEGSVHPADGDGAVPTRRPTLHVGSDQEELLLTMFSRRGADPRLEANQLSITPDELTFVESLAPLLGDTPRQVKRFVNVFQFLMAMPPSLAVDGKDPSDRAVVAFFAAVHDGLPKLAERLCVAVDDGAAGSLQSVLENLAGVPDAERRRLADWLDDARPQWESLELSRLSTRLDLIHRLSFEDTPHRKPPSEGTADPSVGSNSATGA